MELEDALFKWVQTQAPITGLIGPVPRTRFFKLKVPQGEHFPASVMQRGGDARTERMCATDGAVAVSLQIDHYAKNWQEMAALARAFRNALRRDVVAYPIWMGDGDSPSVAVKVKVAFLDNQFDSDDPEPGLYRRTQLWTFWIWEP